MFTLRGHYCRIRAELGSDGTWAKEFPWGAPLHPNHTGWLAMNKVEIRETPWTIHPGDNDRLEPSDLRIL